jgi:hypothetical protein
VGISVAQSFILEVKYPGGYMGRHKLFFQDAKMVRDHLNAAAELAEELHEKERTLVKMLQNIDRKKFYVRYGYSLMGFCHLGLKFSKTQAQRIATRVRRSEPTANFVAEDCLTKVNPVSHYDMSYYPDQLTK